MNTLVFAKKDTSCKSLYEIYGSCLIYHDDYYVSNGLQLWGDLQQLTHSLIYLVGLVSSLGSIRNGNGLGKG